MTLRPLAGPEISPVFPAAKAPAFSLILRAADRVPLVSPPRRTRPGSARGPAQSWRDSPRPQRRKYPGWSGSAPRLAPHAPLRLLKDHAPDGPAFVGSGVRRHRYRAGTPRVIASAGAVHTGAPRPAGHDHLHPRGGSARRYAGRLRRTRDP